MLCVYVCVCVASPPQEKPVTGHKHSAIIFPRNLQLVQPQGHMSLLCSPGAQEAQFWNTLCIHRADTSISLFLMLAGVYVTSSGVGLDTKISSPKTGCRSHHFWGSQSVPEIGMWPFMPLCDSVTEPGLKDGGAVPLPRADRAPGPRLHLLTSLAFLLIVLICCVMCTNVGAATTDQRKDSS